jgi:hypothetical protein
LLEERLLL